ncbi:prefoldin subunit alpha [Caldivirga maquilingensis]|uniref:Prefoldin subunit alpha n=1 Tax=Caldivirga maquilingensis (strain ATCC 700844 / DSM 13496 / JCM 10307 / IC-167) TaxID=397948 RepID=A8MD50_CALMQ|nr:prefoldin subunit alpha [Caldivirga maquilingensis]ABW01706.1 prefoldin, alpha subunit [Caldivirga maquilingensis IC-167]
MSEGRRVVITQDQLEELTERYNELVNLVNTLSQNLTVLNMTINELNNAKAVLEQLSKGVVSDSYVTIGAGVYVKAEAKDTSKVLVDIGEDYVAEMPIPQAIELINSRLNELNAARERLEQELAQAIRSSSEVRDLLTVIYSSLARPQGGAVGPKAGP